MREGAGHGERFPYGCKFCATFSRFERVKSLSIFPLTVKRAKFFSSSSSGNGERRREDHREPFPYDVNFLKVSDCLIIHQSIKKGTGVW